MLNPDGFEKTVTGHPQVERITVDHLDPILRWLPRFSVKSATSSGLTSSSAYSD